MSVSKPPNIDPVEQASRDSFPASDPPGWMTQHPGRPKRGPTTPREREMWNAAIEEAARLIERAGSEPVPPQQLIAGILALKQAGRA